MDIRFERLLEFADPGPVRLVIAVVAVRGALPMPDSRLHEAAGLFNAGEYFACHDVLEDLWSETLGPERELYQGLIQAAVALHHFSEGNYGGARRLYDIVLRRLTPYAPSSAGVDVAGLLNELSLSFAELVAARAYPPTLEFPESPPQLRIVDGDVLPVDHV